MAKRKRKLRRPESLEEFAVLCRTACEQAPSTVMGLAMTDDDQPGILCLSIEFGDSHAVAMAKIRNLMAGTHRWAAMASRVNWTKEPEPAPTRPCWALLCVQEDLPALAACGGGDYGQEWCRIAPGHLPWFMASSAGACRGWLRGEFTALKQVPIDDARLFASPGEGMPPPADENGWL